MSGKIHFGSLLINGNLNSNIIVLIASKIYLQIRKLKNIFK